LRGADDEFEKVLETPKSEIQISQGLKSRDKTVVVGGVKGDGEEAVRWARELLDEAANE
jgi:uncharacterized protein YggU (UPF0235/DUF167 family)